MSIIQDILAGVGILWQAEKDKINANFEALNADKVEAADVPTVTSDLTNDSFFVSDATYVATDNNFTDAQAAAIVTNTAKRSYPSLDESRLTNTSGTNTGDQDLSSYAVASDITTALAGKVDVDGAKILSDVNYSPADKVLVDTIVDKQSAQVGYGLSEYNYSASDASKVANLPINTINSLVDKADLSSGVVPMEQLPDDVKSTGVVQHTDLASFPVVGNVAFVYLAKDTNILYRWNSIAYVTVSAGVDLAGSTELGKAISDTDLMLINDVLAGDNKSFLASRLWTYVQSKLTALADISGWSSVLDEDNMVSDSATKVATQQSIKAYVSSVTADGTLNTDLDVSNNSWVLDEDNMPSNDNTKLATQQSIKAYVDRVAGLQNNGSATVDPAVTDDTSAGYAPGSIWINLTSDTVFICVDEAVGAAVWKDTSSVAAGWNGDITDINIAGGTDVGADFDGTELVVLDDDPLGGTLRKSAVSRFWTYIASKLANANNTILHTIKLQAYTQILIPYTSVTSFSINVDLGSQFLISLDDGAQGMSIYSDNGFSGVSVVTVYLQQLNGLGTMTWPTNVKFFGTAPDLSTTSGEIDVFTFTSLDDNNNWMANYIGVYSN